jgi:glycogen synthase
MKICFVCCEYPPGLHGGIGSFIQTLARALVNKGHEVRVCGIYPSDLDYPKYEEDQGVRVWRYGCSPVRFSWLAARYKLFKTIESWASKDEIDLVEVADWEGYAAGWPMLPIPVIVRLHGSLTYFSSEMELPIDKKSYWLESKSFHRADYCCSTSVYTAEKTQQLFGQHSQRPRVLYCPVDMQLSATSVRDKNTVVFAGSLTRKKGIIQLIDAWNAVVLEKPDAQLHVYGKDAGTEDRRPLQPLLEQRLNGIARKSVHFYGHVSREHLRTVYRTCRAAVFPSYAEAFSLAPVEAMSEGCPVIYSTRHSGPELITHESHGLLVDPDDQTAITHSILLLLENDGLALRLGENGRQHVRERFAVERVHKDNSNFYESCIDHFAAAKLGKLA